MESLFDSRQKENVPRMDNSSTKLVYYRAMEIFRTRKELHNLIDA